MADITKESVLEAMQAFAKMKMEQEAQRNSVNVSDTTKFSSQDTNTSDGVFSTKAVYKKEKEFFNTPEMEQNRRSIFDKIFNTKQPFESISDELYTISVFDDTCQYERYNKVIDFGENFSKGATDEETVENLLIISKHIIDDIEKLFGGLDRITDFYVFSNILIINGVSYEPILSTEYINSLPVDMQYEVQNGQFAWLFNFNDLKKMKHLTNLAFDSFDFVYKKVRVDIDENERKNFEPRDLFNAIRNLKNLQIGNITFTKENVSQFNDVFATARFSTKLLDAVEEWFATKTNSNVVRLKDYYHNPEKRGIRKWIGLTFNFGSVVVAGGGTLATKVLGKALPVGGEIASKAGRTFKNGVKAVIQACKDIE